MDDTLKCEACHGEGIDLNTGDYEGKDYIACGVCGGLGVTPDPCATGCQFAKDVGMWPYHSCGGVCQYRLAETTKAC